ncbi:phosphatase PAP2 family protein [Streptomyces canus]|uniref:phosphatase PAP2 family protein n=1 Tax=Streptomyces canus TaxID=58343 RepID=UPI00225BB779|nr:phosphatase PAP2 family protein [Streptomyces canus]MCX4856133.1 phosphatase PAP2 family protein [Streptomyces canus]WSW38386.1 phosphatase PAP2 family protein [Streptomyces canus]
MKRGDVAELAGSCGLGAWTAFGVLTMVVIGHDGAPLFTDGDLLTWSVGHRPDVAVAFTRGLTATGTGVIPYVLAALAGIIVGRTLRQRALAAALCLACLGTGQILRYAVMALVARPRPPRTDWQTHASGWAFPSGHATTAALATGLLIIAVLVRSPRGKTPLALVIGIWGALVGLTRIYLGVHWFTDVVGGWLFALGWLGVCLCAVAWWLPERWAPDMKEEDAVHDAKGPMASADDRTDTAREQRETHAPDHPGRRGRSRPA